MDSCACYTYIVDSYESFEDKFILMDMRSFRLYQQNLSLLQKDAVDGIIQIKGTFLILIELLYILYCVLQYYERGEDIWAQEVDR